MAPSELIRGVKTVPAERGNRKIGCLLYIRGALRRGGLLLGIAQRKTGTRAARATNFLFPALRDSARVSLKCSDKRSKRTRLNPGAYFSLKWRITMPSSREKIVDKNVKFSAVELESFLRFCRPAISHTEIHQTQKS